jgi:DHA1 family inner membrane transport protein
MVAGSAALFARTPVVQARLVAAVDPAARPVVLALNGSMVFAGQGLGAALGSVAAGIGGIGALGFAGAAVALLGAALAMPLAATPRAAFTR